VLGIPYQYKFKTVKEIPAPDGKVERREVKETAIANAYFLPETLNVSGGVQTQKLHRGICDAVVYRAQTVPSGKFAASDFGPLKIDLKDVQWKDAFVTIAINDLRGTREAIVLDWGGTKRSMLPGSQVPGYTTGATASLGSDQPIGTEVQFSIPLDFNGSEGIFFAPFGVQNEATLKRTGPTLDFAARFFPQNDRFARTGSTQNGRFRITGGITRNRGRAAPATSVLRPKRFQTRSSGRNSCRSWMRIVTSNAPSNTVCSFSCSFSQRSFCSKLRRARKSIRFSI
jgi:inner membrane protein